MEGTNAAASTVLSEDSRGHMAQLKFSAGEFELVTWTEGHPMWMELRHRGHQEANFRFHHAELKDLAHVIERMLAQAKAAMPERYRSEFD